MQNIDVRFNATSNFSKVKGDLAALQAQAAALGEVFAKNAYAHSPQLVRNPDDWRKATRGVTEASAAFRNAAASSGLFNTQQIRATSEAERYTKALQKQKLGIQDMLKHRGIMKEVYRDQLRMQRMTAQYWGTDAAGRAVTDIAVPHNIPRDLDTMGQRMRFFGDMTKSAGMQMINLGKNVQWAGRQLMVGFTYPLALLGAGAGMAAYQVSDAFGKINKVYDVHGAAINNMALREKELGVVRQQSLAMAQQVAEDYGITIEKTLQVEQALAATGLTVKDGLLEATREVQRISSLGDIDPAQTTEMVVALQTAFKLNAEELTKTLNFMNATSNVTSLSLQDIAEATPRAASGLAALGVTAEEMTILLVSMREAGVNAAEGANALKSATTRIVNDTILKKATEIFKKAGASINVKDISEKSGANLMKFIKMLGKAMAETDELTKREKAAAVGALFGTYQFNRLNAALVNVGDAYSGMNNQTAKAIKLQSKSEKELSGMAKTSEELMQAEVAFKFRQAWAKFHAELAEMGQPFLAAGTEVLKMVGKLTSAFNNLDPGTKKWIMIGAIAAGLAGPLIMITGLFLNLFGHVVKGFGAASAVMGRFLGGQKLVTKEEQAATLTAEAQNRALQQVAITTSTLAKETQVLAAAYQQATSAARAFAETQGVVSATGTTAAAATRRPIGPQLPTIRGKGLDGGTYSFPTAAEANAYYATAQRNERGLIRSNKERVAEAKNAVAQQDKMNARAAIEQKSRDRITNSIGGATAGMVAMGAAAGLLMLDINNTTNNIAKWVLIGTLVVPAVKAMAVAMASAAKAAVTTAAATLATSRNVAAAAGGRGAALTAGLKGVGAGMASIMSPMSWFVTATATAAGSLWLWGKHIENAREEQESMAREVRENQAGILDLTKAWADATGRAWQNYKRYNAEGLVDMKRKAQSQYDQSVEFYQTPEDEGGGKEKVDEFLNLGEAEQQQSMVIKLSELINNVGLSAKEARREMLAFLDASGMDVSKAAYMVDEIMKKMMTGAGKNAKFNFSSYITDGLEAAFASENPEWAANAGESIGLAFNEGFVRAKDKGAYIKGIEQQFLGQWEKMRQDMLNWFENEGGLEEAIMKWVSPNYAAGGTLSKEEAGRANEMIEYYERMLKDVQSFRTGIFQISGDNKDLIDTDFDLTGLINLERGFFGATAQAQGLASSVDTMNDFLNETQIIISRMNKGQQQKYMNQLWTAWQGVEDKIANAKKSPFAEALLPGLEKARQKILDIMNVMNQMKGTAQGNTPGRAWYNWFNNIKNNADDGKKKVKDLKDEINGLRDKTVNITIKQFGGVFQSAMSATQDAMAESAMNSFNSSWDSRIAGVEAAHEAASNRMERAQENAMDAFDARWERRREAVERAYQQRIDRIEKEIEAEQKANDIRQRMFDKEMERLRRLAERANTNIDFNVAVNTGDLDEAAKIYNNAQANATVQQMEDEQRVAEARAEARINALEKKNERLEKQRDKELKQLQKMEDRMRKHLERVQDARRNALQKQQQDVMNSLDQQRAYEEAVLEERLTLFKAYTARNQRDLERWMREVGLSYDDFGSDVKAKGEAWSTYFRKELASQIRLAGMEVMNDNIWSEVGKKMANKLLNGLGFDNIAEFNKFVRTGQRGGAETNHGGGVVGAGGSGRGNIPEGRGGLDRSEIMVRAQKGEYIVNKRAAAKNMDLLRAINTGNRTQGVAKRTPRDGIGPTTPPMRREGLGALPADEQPSFQWTHYGGPAAFVGGVNTRLFGRGFQHAGQNAYKVGLEKERARERRERQRARRNRAPGGKNVDIPEGTDPRGAAAIRWATSMLGTSGWAGMCLSFVRQAFGHPGGVYDALASWNMASNKYSTAGGVPAGVPVFWTTGSHGHVALSTGGGRLIGTDYPAYDKINRSTIGAVSNWLGSSPAGWSNEINGMPIYPALRKGGTIKYDNTLVNGHKGETMLTAPLTQKFKENVANGGGDEYNVTIDLRGAYIKENVDIEKAVNTAIEKKNTRMGRKRVVK